MDGWVRNSRIRRDALVALAMILCATVLIVAAAVGVLGPAVTLLWSTLAGKIVVPGLAGSGVLGWGLRRHRRQRQRNRTPAQLNAQRSRRTAVQRPRARRDTADGYRRPHEPDTGAALLATTCPTQDNTAMVKHPTAAACPQDRQIEDLLENLPHF